MAKRPIKDKIHAKGFDITVYQDFKPIEFDRFRKEAGYNAFTLSPQKWIKSRNANRCH